MKIEDMIAAKRADCMGCEACANVCPKQAIDMVPDAEGFLYPKLNKDRCVECRQCEQVCPVLNFKERPLIKLPAALAAVNPDWNIRRKSSSGGVFTALSELVLKHGGIIFGAAFNSAWQVVHTSAETLEDIAPMRGSKYVQSRIGDVYRRIKRELDGGREVLFSGTPCQTAGLMYFLRHKYYDNLVLVDLVCKGVTPPKLWEYYIAYRTRGHEVADITFRSKQYGWESAVFKIVFKDCGLYATPLGRDIFGKSFELATTLRPSCSECRFKDINRVSDITIADFWGVRLIDPAMYDNRGTSLVLIHSEKGARLINETQLIKKPADLRQAVVRNPCILASFPADPRRAQFFADISNGIEPITVLEKYYMPPSDQWAQQSGAILANTRYLKWAEIERKLSAPPAVQSVEQSTVKSARENILIVTLPQDWSSSSVVFVDQYVKRYFQGCGLFLLQPAVENGVDKLMLTDRQSGRTYRFNKAEQALTVLTQQLGITSIFINHLIKHDLMFMMNWIAKSKLPYTYFLHDYFVVCPDQHLRCFARFCSENMTNAYCRQHFAEHNFSRVSIENWLSVFGAFLSRAAHVYAPSQYAADIVKRFYPHLNIESRPHVLALPLKRTFDPKFVNERERLRIAFLGNMLPHKGEANLLLANEFVQSSGLPIDFVVIGAYYDEVHVGTKKNIMFAGKYDNRQVSKILAQFETAIAAQLSNCWETYCYTASEAILSGYPVLAMNVGAHAARIAKHDCGWLLPLGNPSRGLEELKQFLQFIVTLPGRRQILQKAKNTARFKNGME